MLPSWANQTVTRIRPAWVTQRGSQKANYENPASLLVIEHCVLEPVDSQDTRGDREATLYEKQLLLPPGSDLRATDLIVEGALALADYPSFVGVKYSVNGEPLVVYSPLGLADYMECRIRAWVHGD